MNKSGFFNGSYFSGLLILASLILSPILQIRAETGAFQSVFINSIENPVTTGEEQAEKRVMASYADLPLSFEMNDGQTDERVRLLARANSYSLFLTDGEAVVKLRKQKDGKIYRSAFGITFDGASPEATVEGAHPRENKSNYFVGDDSTRWQRNIANFGKGVYREIYEGIDAVFYGNRTEFEYDFVVSPNADVNQILLNFKGARDVRIDGDGALILKVKGESIKFAAPVSYQETENGREPVASSYVLKGENKVAFTVGDYDHSKTLVIDPKLIYSTYIGGNAEFIDIVEGQGDAVNGIAIDSAGSAYLTGNTDSTDLPVSGDAWQDELELRGDDACLIAGPLQCGDAFVMKINSTGTAILYSTYLGGHNSDAGFAIAVNASGQAYVTGGTDPFNAGNFCINPYLFPTTLNPYQNKPCYGLRADSDAFFTVLNGSGSDLIYSTYFGGSDEDQGNAIAIDGAGNAYIAGESNSDNLPDKNAFQTDHGNNNTDVNDAFIAKFNPNETGNDSLLYASLLGGNGEDIARGIAVDAAGNAYVVGDTASNNLAVRAPAGQSLPPLESAFNGGASDGFIAKVDPTNASGANSLVSLTYYGGAGRDVINAVTVEATTQRSHITGRSDNATGFPLLNAFDVSATATDAFVAKLNADVTAQFYSSFLGGTSFDEGKAVALDAANNVYLTGKTLSANFPKINAFQTVNAGGGDAFVTKISAVLAPAQPKILYSSFLGGSASTGIDEGRGIGLDKKGNVYVGGFTTSSNFPTTVGVIKTQAPGIVAGNSDGFVAKVESTFNDSIGVFRPGTNQFLLSNSNSNPATNLTIGFGQAGDLPIVGDWNGDGIEDMGVFRPGAGQFLLRKLTTQIVCAPICIPMPVLTTVTQNFGLNGDLPIAGDWDGNGIDTVGVFRQNGGQAQIFLTDSAATNPPIDHTLFFGVDGDLPVAGDWESDGVDGVGVFRPSTGQVFLTSDLVFGNVDINSVFGTNGDLPTAGDFDGDGKDTIAVFRPSTAQFFLSNDNLNIALTVIFGANGDRPVVGDWDGKPNQ